MNRARGRGSIRSSSASIALAAGRKAVAGAKEEEAGWLRATRT